MSLITDLYTYLSGKQQLTDLLGTGVDFRLWPKHVPQRKKDPDHPRTPYAVFNKISDVSEHDIDRASGLSEARIQFNVFDPDPEMSERIADALRLCLDGAGVTQWGDTKIHSVKKDNEIDLNNVPVDGSDDWLEQTAVDYMIRYETSVPQFN